MDSKIKAVKKADLKIAREVALDLAKKPASLNKADAVGKKHSLLAAATAPAVHGRAVGDTCAEPIVVSIPGDLAYSDTNNLQGHVDDYNDAVETCLDDYDTGEDVIYELNVTAATCVNIVLTEGGSTSLYLSATLGATCPPYDCLEVATSGNPDELTSVELAVGTYYLMIDNWPTPTDCPYTLEITECPAGGACCHLDGSCTDEADAAACGAAGGVYEGGGTACATTECPQPCIPDATVDFATQLPFTDTAQTNCGLGDEYDATCMGNYDNGEEFIYELVVATETCVNIALAGGGTTYTGIAVGAECPPETCIALSGTSATNESIDALTLAPGTYYLMVDTWSTPDCIPAFDLTITECPAGGACCHTDGSCTDEADEAACTTAGGTYEGGGTACATTDCPQPPPVNDECANAIAIGEVTDLAWNTGGATDGTPGAHTICQNIWYCYTPTVSGFLTVDLCGAGFDTKVAVWEGCACDPTVELAFDDDDCPSKTTRSLIHGEELSVVAGQQYLIEVGGYENYSGVCAAGAGTMTVSVTEPPEPWACCRDYNVSCEEVLEAACDGVNDTWYDGQLCAEVTCPDPPTTGACCDGGVCTDGVFEVDCAGIWFGGQDCVDVEPCPGPGDSCDLPLPVSLASASMPFVDNNTNCGRGDNYDDLCDGYYGGGEDIIYELNVTEALGCVDIEVITTNGDTYIGVGIASTCPASPTCLAVGVSGSTSVATIEDLVLPVGTYYLMIDSWPSPACLADFQLTISECVVPTGACCVDEACAATNTQLDCDGLGGDWFQGEDCATFECPTDVCAGALYSQIERGTGDDEGAQSAGRDRDGTSQQPNDWIVDDVTFMTDVEIQDFHWLGNESNTYNFGGFADFLIMTDDGGNPGTIVYEIEDVAATRIDTGEVAFGDPVWRYDINSNAVETAVPAGVVLAAGTYWIGVRPVQELPYGTGQYDRGWWMNTPPNATAEMQISINGADFVTSSEYFDENPSFHMAFCITGEVTGAIPEGACCDDSTGVCTDPVLMTECLGASQRFAQGETCATAVFDPACGEIVGACCHPDGTCDIMTDLDCADNWLGADTTCDECPCVSPCPAGATIEAEACGDAENEGCNGDPVVFDPISCGETICGTGWADGSSRDTDWFEVVVTEPTVFTFSGEAENFHMAIGKVNTSDCATATELDPFASGGPCEPLSITTECLPPGTYWFFAAPSSYNDVWPCDANYHVELTCEAPCVIPTGACCQSDGTCAEVYEDDCTGTYRGDDTLCSSNGICEGACCAPDGSCTDTFEDDCADYFKGLDTDCATYTCPVVPDNDLCENAIAIGTLPASVQVDNTAATDDDYEPCGFTSDLVMGVWYTVVGDGSTFTASTCNVETLNTDTKISVYCGNCDYLMCVAGDDDDSNCTDKNYLTTVSWCTEDGVEYYIWVGSFNDTHEGLIQLDVSKDGVPCTGAVDCTIPSGACCDGEVCSVEFVHECTGVYIGDDTTCDPNPCTMGACCEYPSGNCSVLTEVDCVAASGNFQGNGSTCETVVCPTPGDTCEDPMVINIPADLDYHATNTTCGRNADYNETCLDTYDEGEDMIFELNVTEDVVVNIKVETPIYEDYHGIIVDNVCPPGDPCMMFSNYGNPDEFESVALTVGTYYLMVSHPTTSNCSEFDVDIWLDVPCEVECTGTPEIEICTNGANDGCGGDPADPALHQVITCDETVCAHAWSNSELRDIDVYEATVTENTILTFAVEAEFSIVAQVGITGPTCDDYVVLLSGEADECEELVLTTECLPAGTYWFLVAPSDWFDPAMPCDGEFSDYRVTLTCETACVIPTGACCQTDGTCAEVYEENCTGTYRGDDTLCSSNGICEGACCEPDGTCTDGFEDACAFAFQGLGTNCAETTCPVVPVNDTCGGAIEVGCDTVLVGEVMDSATDDYSPGEYPDSCTGYSAAGHDLTYVITFASDTEATITVANATFDSALYVVTDCADTVGTCVVGADDNVSTRDSETLTYTFPAGTYYIIVDGYSVTTGTFDLQIVADCGCCDLDADGLCNSNDYWEFTDTMGSCDGNPKFNALADLDGDGCITLVDYGLWLVCYRAERSVNLGTPAQGGLQAVDQVQPVSAGVASDSLAPAGAGQLTGPRTR